MVSGTTSGYMRYRAKNAHTNSTKMTMSASKKQSAGYRRPEWMDGQGSKLSNVAMTPVPIVTENHDGVKCSTRSLMPCRRMGLPSSPTIWMRCGSLLTCFAVLLFAGLTLASFSESAMVASSSALCRMLVRFGVLLCRVLTLIRRLRQTIDGSNFFVRDGPLLSPPLPCSSSKYASLALSASPVKTRVKRSPYDSVGCRTGWSALDEMDSLVPPPLSRMPVGASISACTPLGLELVC